MKEHSLVRLAETQGVARLGRRPPADVAKRDHVALARRQIGDRLEKHPARLIRCQALLRRLPGRRRARPLARMLIAGRLKAIRVDGGLVATFLAAPSKERERQDPALALAAGPRLVQKDAGEPGPKRRASLEAVDPARVRRARCPARPPRRSRGWERASGRAAAGMAHARRRARGTRPRRRAAARRSADAPRRAAWHPRRDRRARPPAPASWSFCHGADARIG